MLCFSLLYSNSTLFHFHHAVSEPMIQGIEEAKEVILRKEEQKEEKVARGKY